MLLLRLLSIYYCRWKKSVLRIHHQHDIEIGARVFGVNGCFRVSNEDVHFVYRAHFGENWKDVQVKATETQGIGRVDENIRDGTFPTEIVIDYLFFSVKSVLNGSYCVSSIVFM